MKQYRGTLRYLYAHWPVYLLLYGSMIAALLFIGFSSRQGWWGYVPLTLALLMVLVYFFLASLWSAHQQRDVGGLRPYDILFDLGRVEATETLLYIDLGLRYQSVALSRRLTTGQVMVVDIYNPQWMSSQALVRLRRRMPSPPADPRLVWLNGSLDLLPLPDNSVPVVVVSQVLQEFWQEGDRLQLLAEVYRVLQPNGRLLLAEQTRSRTNWMLLGPAAFFLYSAVYWKNMLLQAGFQVRKEQNLQGILHCYRADKPLPAEAQQLKFEL